MQQEVRTLQVFEELNAQSGTVGRAFDKPWYIGNHKINGIGGAHHAQVRMQRSERVVSHFRPGVRHGPDERRLAGVRHSEQAHISQHLQFELEFTFLTLLARGVLARRSVGTGLEMDVAQAAVSPSRQNNLSTIDGEIGDDLAGRLIGDHRTNRHAQYDIVRTSSVLVRTAPRFSVLGAMDAGKAKINQGIDIAICYCNNAAAASAITAIRATLRHKLLAAKRRHAPATVTGLDLDTRFINEFHRTLQLSGEDRLTSPADQPHPAPDYPWCKPAQRCRRP